MLACDALIFTAKKVCRYKSKGRYVFVIQLFGLEGYNQKKMITEKLGYIFLNRMH